MFIVENHLGDLELDKKETNGMRLYKLPNGDWVLLLLQSPVSTTETFSLSGDNG